MKSFLQNERDASPSQTSASPLPPNRDEKSKIIARLKESFSRGKTPAFQEAKKAQPKHVPASQGLLQMFAGFSASSRKKILLDKESEDGSEVDERNSPLAGRKLEKSNEDTDSGLGSISAKSDGGLSRTPEAGLHFRTESAAGTSKGESRLFSREIQSSEGGSSGVFWPSEPNQSEDDGLARQATSSPKAKRFKIRQPLSPKANFSPMTPEQDSGAQPLYDVPVKMAKRTVSLAMPWSNLTDRIQRQMKRQETEGEMLKFRKFRAKINPGENKTAEDELRKEIRYGSSESQKYLLCPASGQWS